ncbi:MAG: hypothetical protein KME60_27835 [Cyanomargarita calcarea GSE-NOS-MK-12-04C]|jgi:hypothetical protein|uniref:Uncharacterized protein n=1 Tax=Cyanomargarita calcarea GSE-NOS-MK-12-04C TaxID=2839659 RepID=A0A951QS05_9CYAN|nr:hypothetical protein [Cyanomargarita calcarea GSE-NOS-MK-12-04C]
MNIKYPKGRTAFFIIHGVGEQNPFETVDFFARNLIQSFEAQKSQFQLEHLIAKRRKASGYFWTESFVRLSSINPEEDWIIDVHEYYWAAATEKKISVPEILQWAEQTLEGTIKFYSHPENQPLLTAIEQNKDDSSVFNFRLRRLTIFLRLFQFIYPALRLLIWLVLFLLNPFLSGRFLQSAWTLSKTIVTPLLVNVVADVAIYSNKDVKSPYQKIREEIFNESSTLLKAIIKDKEANYDQVIVAGHSLGSCIAYDTLNLLCLEASLSQDKGKRLLLDKITGLVTFGSPLDKIAFFCREVSQKDHYIRSYILGHLNSFRVKPQAPYSDKYLTKNPVDCQLDQLQWVNYYHLKDPISGHLDYYNNLDNVLMEYETSWGYEAHLDYFSDNKFYDDIAQRFLYPH